MLSKDKKTNYGVFPATKEGLQRAREWALQMKEETGVECKVKKF